VQVEEAVILDCYSSAAAVLILVEKLGCSILVEKGVVYVGKLGCLMPKKEAVVVAVAVPPPEDVDAKCSTLFWFHLGNILCECSADVLCCHTYFLFLFCSLHSVLTLLLFLNYCSVYIYPKCCIPLIITDPQVSVYFF
jgi:hypothetical protein